MITTRVLREVISMQAAVVQTFGGTQGVRDLGALQAALMRSQLARNKSPVDQAAALMEGIVFNRPFASHNLLTAFFICDTFLRVNDMQVSCDAKETADFFLKLAKNNQFEFSQLQKWFQQNTKKLSTSNKKPEKTAAKKKR